MPAFLCLQEAFELSAAQCLVCHLAPSLRPVPYDVGTLGLQPGPSLKLLGSGLLPAWRYPLQGVIFHRFPNASREDALASKAQVQPQPQYALDGDRVSKGKLARCQQLTLLLHWAEQLEANSCQGGEMAAWGQEAQPCPSAALLSFSRRQAGTETQAASETPAGWAQARIGPGPWCHAWTTPPADSCSWEVEQGACSAGLAGLMDHLAAGLQLRISLASRC
ncbi:sphingomyelin phosphodiesterase 5-like [Ctenodactylus gundi]